MGNKHSHCMKCGLKDAKLSQSQVQGFENLLDALKGMSPQERDKISSLAGVLATKSPDEIGALLIVLSSKQAQIQVPKLNLVTDTTRKSKKPKRTPAEKVLPVAEGEQQESFQLIVSLICLRILHHCHPILLATLLQTRLLLFSRFSRVALWYRKAQKRRDLHWTQKKCSSTNR
jgi:hypothetical protein